MLLRRNALPTYCKEMLAMRTMPYNLSSDLTWLDRCYCYLQKNKNICKKVKLNDLNIESIFNMTEKEFSIRQIW